MTEEDKAGLVYHGVTHGRSELDSNLLYREDVTGPQGARFTIYREAHHSDEDIKAAKWWLRTTRDVVKIYVEVI